MKDWHYLLATAIIITVSVVVNALCGFEIAAIVTAGGSIGVASTFIWAYATDGWEKSWFGRSLMLLAVSVLLYSVAVVLRQTLGDYSLRPTLLLTATTGTLIAMTIRTMVLLSVMRVEKNAKQEALDEHHT